MACVQNFEATPNQIKFKHYLFNHRNPCKQFILQSDDDPFYELKNGLKEQLNPFVNIEEAVDDLDPLRNISQIMHLRWFNLVHLFIALGKLY